MLNFRTSRLSRKSRDITSVLFKLYRKTRPRQNVSHSLCSRALQSVRPHHDRHFHFYRSRQLWNSNRKKFGNGFWTIKKCYRNTDWIIRVSTIEINHPFIIWFFFCFSSRLFFLCRPPCFFFYSRQWNSSDYPIFCKPYAFLPYAFLCYALLPQEKRPRPRT